MTAGPKPDAAWCSDLGSDSDLDSDCLSSAGAPEYFLFKANESADWSVRGRC